MSNPIQVRLHLEPPPCGEALEEIEDLIASILARHGYTGRIELSATGNSTCVRVRPRVDDGRGYVSDTGVTRGDLAHALRRMLAYMAIHDSPYYETNADALKARAWLERLGAEDAVRDADEEGIEEEDWDDDAPSE